VDESALNLPEIKAILDTYYEAFHAQDWPAFAEPLADEFRYYTDNATILPKPEFLRFLQSEPWVPVRYSMSDYSLHGSDAGDLAVATYTMRFTGIVGENEVTIVALETAVFRRIARAWKLVHFHSSNKVLE
jgi:ketosteroid isomerase-like protein